MIVWPRRGAGLGLGRNKRERLEIEAMFAALIGPVACCAGLAVAYSLIALERLQLGSSDDSASIGVRPLCWGRSSVL